MKPVRLAAAATLALPRWALFALGLLYILPGLIGREPWKNDDAASFGIMWTMAHGTWQDWLWPNIAGLSWPDEGPLAFWLGAVCIKLFGWLLGDVLAARVSTVGIFLAGVLSLWYATFHLGRRPDAQPLRLAFGGQPEPDDFGRTLADSAVLIYLGCLGLLLHSHETTPDALQVSMTAFLLYRTARYMEKPSLRNAALSGLAIGLMTLSGGWIVPVSLMLALFACTRVLGQPTMLAVRDLGAMIAIGGAVTALWLIPAQLLEPYHQQPLNAWLGWNWLQLDWPTWAAVKFFFRVGVWFFWPAWPFACWAVWAWRRQRGALHIVVPLAFVVMGLLLTLCNPQPDQGQLLVLLPPLAIMAAFGLLTMKRGAINAIDWFSVMALTLCAAIIWIFYFAKLIGWPAKAARNVLKLVPGYTPELGWIAFFVALAATLGWFVLVHWRVSRRPAVLWRAVVLSSGGFILIWILSVTLFLPELNYGKSYASVARQIADKLPPGANCIETNVGPAQRASFAFYAQLPFVGVEGGRCDLLLLQDSIKARDNREILPQHRGKQWVLLWEGRRPADRQERFRLYRRAD